MRIVITGALGHIGSQLIRELPAVLPSAEIVMVDNMAAQRYCSLFNLPAHGHYDFIEADVLTADLERILAGADVTIHLAAITNAADSFQIREQVEEVNFIGTQRVAKVCAEQGSRLIFISTTSVYGTQSAVVDENCPLEDLRPQSPYAHSKLQAEQFLEECGIRQGLRFVACRFGTIFGPSVGMRFHTAINKFCWQAVMGQPLSIWRTALHQKRPYLDLFDGVRALSFILEHELFDNQVYNILTVNATVNDIVELIRLHVPDVQIEYVDAQIMNQLSYTVACDKFQAHGFKFGGDLKKGISDTIELLQQARSNALAQTRSV
jgi:UDP-glucose 4-epimerase